MSVSTVTRKAPRVLPPSSTFSELLRRSKFASFDPDIRQTYSAPPSYIHRGNWGLKRPLANKKRDSAIVLRNFEEHAQYTDWERADGQVNFIRRTEELNIAPSLVMFSPWFYGLGPLAVSEESGIDSDFCPGEDSKVDLIRDERHTDRVSDAPKSSSTTTSSLITSGKNGPSIDLKSLGNKGSGSYGANPRALPRISSREDEVLPQPNIKAMTPVQFQRYLEKLRSLRPKFLEYIRSEMKKDQAKNNLLINVNLDELTDEELVFVAGTEAKRKHLHMGFLGRYTEEHMFKATEEPEEAATLANVHQPIRKQPHKFGGLLYAQPSHLETYHYSRSEPGFVLQDSTPIASVGNNQDKDYIASFSGITAHLRKRDAEGGLPLYEPATSDGINVLRMQDPSDPRQTIIDTSRNERKMRITKLQLEEVPKVVGRHAPSYTLGSTRVRANVASENVGANWRDNPYAPGSREYIVAKTESTLKSATVANRPPYRMTMYSSSKTNTTPVKPSLPRVSTDLNSADASSVQNQKTTAALEALKKLITHSNTSTSYNQAPMVDSEKSGKDD